ncbi:hypothetical protein NC652_020864 [Populus alba x Populus x berolinensis]|nr:hypothetical protein NC652_020864 [Populus alba x Populus x berolinensis]
MSLFDQKSTSKCHDTIEFHHPGPSQTSSHVAKQSPSRLSGIIYIVPFFGPRTVFSPQHQVGKAWLEIP